MTRDMMRPLRRRIAVVIPYFQREAGILSRALDSVRAQELPRGVSLHVYLVDDGSPLAAGAEIVDASALTLITQANGGPGAARNAALDRIEADGGADFVAFLDSDDIWHPIHLAEAVAALDRGYDFYCCDNARPGTFALFSEANAALRGGGAALRPRARVLDKDGPVLGFAAGTLCDEIAIDYISHTSTVVVAWERLRSVRFDPELRGAGEDRMFWLELALAGARIAISWRCNVTCGTGVNLFFSAHDWNSPATLERFASQLLFAEKLKRQQGLSQARRDFAARRIRNCRRAYGFLFLRSVLKTRRVPRGSFRRLWSRDPLLPLRIPVLFLAVLLDTRPPARRLQAE
jgi:succinoglycan biosynthesis protein ExoW